MESAHKHRSVGVLHVLALEPYYGGSHKAMLDHWRDASRHAWDVRALPAHQWKWRMRHSPVTFLDMLRRSPCDPPPDLLFTCDMLNLAEFRGLAAAHPETRALAATPCVVYFHENQLTYPVRHEDERDLHFAMIHLTTALAADAVWFNTAFHRDDFLTAIDALLGRMPHVELGAPIETIRGKSSVQSPGVRAWPARESASTGPLKILWAARWEFDKNPEDFFAAVERLEEADVDFRLSVIGEQFRDSPAVFDRARERFAHRIDDWGFLPTRADYENALRRADVIVSTAIHEFFGISVVEAMAAGAWPLLPERLAYPELLAPLDEAARPHLYDGSPEMLADRLTWLAKRKMEASADWLADIARTRTAALRFEWGVRADEMDAALECVIGA